jgi:glycosyltransferase involved in cell wall biosynthesis
MVHPVYGFYLAHLIEKQSVGHIHAYCTTKTSNFALVAAHMLDIGFSINSYVDFDFPAPYKLLDEKLELCDFDVVHTMFCKERLLSYTSEKYRSKIHVIRFGLTLDEFIPREKSDSMKLRLLCIGNLVPKKGHRFLIKACEVLRDKGVDFELLIVGAGVMRPQLEELVAFLNLQDRIRFVGGVPNDKVADFLTPDAILVVPSIYAIDGERDGMPTIISEAMVMGTPVISTYVSGIPEVIKNGVNGLLVPPEDSNSLADAIVKLAGDTKLREDLIKNGRETVKELFDHRKWIPEIVKLLHQSLAGDI